MSGNAVIAEVLEVPHRYCALFSSHRQRYRPHPCMRPPRSALTSGDAAHGSHRLAVHITRDADEAAHGMAEGGGKGPNEQTVKVTLREMLGRAGKSAPT